MNQRSKSTQHQNLLYLRIETDAEPDTKVLAALLNALNPSFQSFIQAELYFRNSEIKSSLKKEINAFTAECSLLIRNFQSDVNKLTIAVDIDALNRQFRQLKNPAELKAELFDLYADTVFSTELFSPAFIQKLAARYNAKQRIEIFKPFTDLTEKQQFRLFSGREANTVNFCWKPTDDLSLMSSLIPEAVKLPKEPVETYYQYIKTGEENDLFGKRSKYEKVLIKENPKHDLYPYQLQKITVKGKKYTFGKQLSATVSVKNSFYEIGLPDLLLSVQHENRAGAEKAFDAALSVLITQLEKDQSPKNLNLVKLKGLLNEY
ncbi:MAG: hypothetical protein EOP42_13935 [Sphingobacteriaceae bacterium]|nr:MAG: hypothetical protein EOP42_13935 [Sphingobacteriaceae bacterium]